MKSLDAPPGDHVLPLSQEEAAFIELLRALPDSVKAEATAAAKQVASTHAKRVSILLAGNLPWHLDQPRPVRFCAVGEPLKQSSSLDVGDPSHPRKLLWSNICSLIGEADPTIFTVRDRIKVSQGTVQRLRYAETSVGIDMVQSIAEQFGLDAWQLIAPPRAPQALPPDANSTGLP
jgi:hypothetical protein